MLPNGRRTIMSVAEMLECNALNERVIEALNAAGIPNSKLLGYALTIGGATVLQDEGVSREEVLSVCGGAWDTGHQIDQDWKASQ